MPRYYFNLCEGDRRLDDPDGVICANLMAARDHALVQVRDVMSHCVRDDGAIDLSAAIEIADTDGRMVAKVRFADSIVVRQNVAPTEHSIR